MCEINTTSVHLANKHALQHTTVHSNLLACMWCTAINKEGTCTCSIQFQHIGLPVQIYIILCFFKVMRKSIAPYFFLLFLCFHKIYALGGLLRMLKAAKKMKAKPAKMESRACQQRG